MSDDHRQTKQQNDRSRRAQDKALPLGSTFNDLFAGGAPVWLKIIGGAVATPLAVTVLALRANRRGGAELPKEPAIIAATLGGCAIVGALLGAALSLKDVVQVRLANGQPVAFPLKLLFGFGLWSLLLVWFPGTIILTLVVTILALS